MAKLSADDLIAQALIVAAATQAADGEQECSIERARLMSSLLLRMGDELGRTRELVRRLARYIEAEASDNTLWEEELAPAVEELGL